MPSSPMFSPSGFGGVLGLVGLILERIPLVDETSLRDEPVSRIEEPHHRRFNPLPLLRP